jgi:antirestriction protein
MSISPNIYVASLSDYNNGNLLGVTIELEGKDESEVWQEINAMLKQSKYPNVMRRDCECLSCGHKWTQDVNSKTPLACPECLEDDPDFMEYSLAYPSAEEFAIHSYDLGGIRISEYEAIKDVLKISDALVEHEEDGNGETFALYVQNVGVEAAIDNYEEAFLGEYDSERAYAENLLDDTGQLDAIPENLRGYFDYESFARDLFMDGYSSERLSNGGVAVFLDV